MSVDKFEQKLREKFEAVSIPPSPELWGNIESRIPQKEKKRGVVWFWAGGVSIAASLLVWLWLSNAAVSTPLETESGISQTESAPPQSEEDLLKYETKEPSTSSFTENKSTEKSEQQNNPNRQQLITTPDLGEKVAVRKPNDERSAKQQYQNTQLASQSEQSDLPVSPKPSFVIKTLDFAMASAPIILDPQLAMLEGWKVEGLETKENWWQELPIEEEKVPRWALNLQAGQDLIGDVDVDFGRADAIPMEDFTNQKASNDALLGSADFVQYARNPGQMVNQEGADQATLVSYPTQETRVKLVGEYKLEGNWSIRSGLGLGLSNLGGLTQAYVVYSSAASPNTIPEGEWAYSNGPSLQNLQVEVPISLQYRIQRSKGAFVLGSGFSFNHNLNYLSQARYNRDGFASYNAARTVFAVSDQANLQSLDENIDAASQSLGYRSWNSFVLLQAQYERPISPRFALYGGPSFKYMLNDVFVGSLASKQAPLRLGITAGVRFGR